MALGIDLDRLPRHVAIIMDGNGRWAQSQGLKRLLGHRKGYRVLKDVLLNCSELGIEALTTYAFSAENWRRPFEEVTGLMKLIEDAARTELQGLVANNVRCRVLGRLDELPEGTRNALAALVQTTKDNTGIIFSLAVNYGGRAEIVDAVKRVIDDGLDAANVTEEALSARMYAPDIPEPDLLIRTAGEMRWSNFLIWEAAYAELYVTQTSWPEFDEAELLKALRAYQARFRKFGGLGTS